MNCNCKYRRRASQNTDVKKMGRREEEGEEDQRKTSKLIAYLNIKSENCKRKTAMLCQIGVSKTSIVYSLQNSCVIS